jgi:hypothetical protein
MTYLAGKPKGDNSMSLKWAISEDVYGMGLQDPHDMVKAILPESQFPAINRLSTDYNV